MLMTDTLYAFSDPDTYKRLKRRASLGVDVKIHRAQGSTELHIEGAAVLTTSSCGGGCDDPFVFRTENEAEAAAWEKALQPFMGLFPHLFFCAVSSCNAC